MTQAAQQAKRPELAVFIGGLCQYRTYVLLHRDEWERKPICIPGPETFRGYNPNGATVVMTRDWRRYYGKTDVRRLEDGLARWETLGGTCQYWD